MASCASLERGIGVSESHAAWSAQDDTDSVLVLLHGALLSDAFHMGKEMATVAALLLAKKRYVGRMLEHSARDTPVLDAKGMVLFRCKS